MAAGLYTLRPIACVAALNATVQGLVGVVLAVIALCVSFCAFGSAPQQQANDFSQYLTNYLQGAECGANVDYGLYNGVTSPAALRVWLVLSLFFSVTMLISSGVLVLAVAKQWSDEKFQITLVSWLFITLFTQIDDVVLGYVFGSDFVTSLAPSGHKDNVGPLTLGIVVFLALRGGYLWLMNLAFIVYLFSGARAFHKYLTEQIPVTEQDPIENWPTLDDFDSSKGMNFEHNPTAINPLVAESVENGQVLGYPEHSARARWPSLNGQAQTVRSPRPVRPVDPGARKIKTLREPRGHRQEGVDNPAFEAENRYYLRLHNEVGSSQDYDEHPPPPGGRRDRERGSQQWEPPRDQGRSRREVRDGATPGHYKRMEDPTSQEYVGGGVPIPPVDYLDPLPDAPGSPITPGTSARILSLQEAILDRTLRLKKVPKELKRGLQIK